MRDGSKNYLIDEGWTSLAVEQSSKYVGTVERKGWYPRGSEPRRPVWNARTKVTVLGAITPEGDNLYFLTEEYLTAEHAIHLLGALKREFGDKLVVFLDQASYFSAKDLWEYVSGERTTDAVDDTTIECVEGEDLRIWYLPSHLPELSPVENCWNQFKNWYKYRFIETHEELKATLPEAFQSISELDLLDYICSQ